MNNKTDFAQIGLIGCIICIILAVTLNTCKAQNRVSFVIAQDLKLATLGDEKRGYDAFTPNVLFRFKMQGKQGEIGYLTIFPEFEYADIQGQYYRYSANVGYSFNKIFDKWTYTPAIGWGSIDRYGKNVFSWSSSLEVSYSINDWLNIIAIGQLTERKDLLLLWGENAIRFSGFVGLEIKL